MIRYSVQDGDRLSTIAERYELSTDEIVAANPHRASVTLDSGEKVFASLAAGDDIEIPLDARPARSVYVAADGERFTHIAGGTIGELGAPGMVGDVNPNVITTGALCGSARNVQQALNDLGYGPIAVDGIVGRGTQAAMKAFGAAFGLGSNVNWTSPAFCSALKNALIEKARKDQAAAAAAAAAAAGQTQTGGTQTTGQTPIEACLAARGTWTGTTCLPAAAPPVQTGGGEITTTTQIMAPEKALQYGLVLAGVVGALGLAAAATFFVVRAKHEEEKKEAA